MVARETKIRTCRMVRHCCSGFFEPNNNIGSNSVKVEPELVAGLKRSSYWSRIWWLERQALVEIDDPTLKEGLKAYALRQAALRHDMGKRGIRKDTSRSMRVSS